MVFFNKKKNKKINNESKLPFYEIERRIEKCNYLMERRNKLFEKNRHIIEVWNDPNILMTDGKLQMIIRNNVEGKEVLNFPINRDDIHNLIEVNKNSIKDIVKQIEEIMYNNILE